MTCSSQTKVPCVTYLLPILDIWWSCPLGIFTSFWLQSQMPKVLMQCSVPDKWRVSGEKPDKVSFMTRQINRKLIMIWWEKWEGIDPLEFLIDTLPQNLNPTMMSLITWSCDVTDETRMSCEFERCKLTESRSKINGAWGDLKIEKAILIRHLGSIGFLCLTVINI